VTYPTSIDDLTSTVPDDITAVTQPLGDEHDDHHRDLGVAVEAIETELGTDPSGGSADVKTRIAAVETLADAAQTAAEVSTAVAAEATLARNADNLTSGTVADARIASTIARDSEVTTAVSDHSADTTSVHGITDTSVLATATSVAAAVDARLSAANATDLTDGGVTSLHSHAGGGGSFGVSPQFVSGQYSPLTPHGGRTTAAFAQNLVQYHPFWVPSAVTFDRIGVEVTTGLASTTVRLGIYNAAGGIPTSLVADYGTVSSVSNAHVDITISQALAAGLYFHAVCMQGAFGTMNLRVSNTFAGLAQNATTFLASFGNTIYKQTGVTGALPGTATPTFGADAAGGAVVYVRTV
jgi:hypothetical protein